MKDWYEEIDLEDIPGGIEECEVCDEHTRLVGPLVEAEDYAAICGECLEQVRFDIFQAKLRNTPEEGFDKEE